MAHLGPALEVHQAPDLPREARREPFQHAFALGQPRVVGHQEGSPLANPALRLRAASGTSTRSVTPLRRTCATNASGGVPSSCMTTSPTLTTAVRGLLAEAIAGEPGGTTWISDGEGLLATVRDLSATRASRSRDGDTSIAAHVEHVRWFLALLNAFARGEHPEIAWQQSWTVREVDTDAWRHLIDAVEREFEELDGHLGRGVDPDDEARLQPTLATVAHAAYHLGALRQMVKPAR